VLFIPNNEYIPYSLSGEGLIELPYQNYWKFVNSFSAQFLFFLLFFFRQGELKNTPLDLLQLFIIKKDTGVKMTDNRGSITLLEACKILNRSKRTVSRKIKAGLLKANKFRTERGIYEYRFSQSEVESLKKRDRGQGTGQNIKTDRNIDDTLTLLKDTVKLLQKQLKAKDNQINKMLERQREANILMGQLQNKVFLLEDKSKGKQPDKTNRTEDTTGDKVNGWLKRLFRRV